MLTSDSNKIIKYIEDNFKLAINGFKELQELYDYLNSIQNHYDIIKSNPNDNNNHLSMENHFISDEIKSAIKSFKKNQNIILKINNNEVNINIYYNDKNIRLFTYNIIIVIAFFTHLMKQENMKFNINYYLTDFKKNINNNINDGFKHEHMNSGSCGMNTINIWRKEEIMKVTIHELFHLFNCDKSYHDNSFILNLYHERYNINSGKVNTFEAYTEIWANILNCYFLSKNNYKSFVKYLSIEKEWCTFQTHKIFYLTDLDKKSKIDINKYTNVLAYFVIRCEIYGHFKDFIRIFGKNICCNSSHYFNFLKNNRKCKRKDDIIKKLSKRSYIYKNLRMSAVEYKLF